MRISRLGDTSQLTTLLALQRFLAFKADDWNRHQRGGGVDPADMKRRIEDQAGKGYAGKVGTRSSIRLSAPKAKSTGLRARHAEKRARAHSTTIQISVTTCNRTIWRDISVPAHPEAWVNVPRPVSSSKLIARTSHQPPRFSPGIGAFKPQRGALSQPRPTAWVSGIRLYAKP